MRRATELARAEADAVERDEAAAVPGGPNDDEHEPQPEPQPEPPAEPEPEPDTEPAEPEPEPEPEPQPAPAAADSGPSPHQLAAFDRANAKHARELRKVMGEDFDAFVQCASCAGVGYTPAGLEPPPEVLHDEMTEPCPKCNGYSIVLTGAREPGMVTHQCSHCAGAGYTTRTVEVPQQQAATVHELPSATSPPYQPPAPAVPPDIVAQLQAAGYVVLPQPAAPPVAP